MPALWSLPDCSALAFNASVSALLGAVSELALKLRL